MKPAYVSFILLTGPMYSFHTETWAQMVYVVIKMEAGIYLVHGSTTIFIIIWGSLNHTYIICIDSWTKNLMFELLNYNLFIIQSTSI